MNPRQSLILIQFLAAAAIHAQVSDHAYIVGGAVRNHLLGDPIKDIDVVIDSVGAGKDSEWFAQHLMRQIPVRSNLTTNNYGVAIVTISEPWELGCEQMKGVTIEIANARKESYGGAEGKGYKPHMVEPATILEDLVRREATCNTLLWRLSDLKDGIESAPVLDLLGKGLDHLRLKELHTPADPDKTFSDDPTRCLRFIKFALKYGFTIPDYIVESIQRNAKKIREMPWDAVRKILVDDLLFGARPVGAIGMLVALGLSDELYAMMIEHPGFAASVGRDLAAKGSVELAFRVHNVGWPVRTKISFLDEEQRDLLLRLSHGLADLEAFVLKLHRPPIDQEALFQQHNIPPKERGRVVLFARDAMLANPSLAKEPEALQQVVSQALQASVV